GGRGPEGRPPSPAGPGLGHADPARAVPISLSLAIPVELHLHPTVLVAEELPARRADNGRGLDAGDDRPGNDPGWPVRQADRNTAEAVLVGQVGRGLVVALVVAGADGQPRRVLDPGEQVGPIGVEMAREGELVTRSEVRAEARALDREAETLLLLHADPDGPLLVL